MAQQRSDVWDIAKGIGIILVVYGHVARGLVLANLLPDTPVIQGIDAVIYSFHMPLFFFISGVFFLGSLERHGWLGMTLGKVDTVFYPYVIWSLLQGFIEVGLSRFTNGHTTVSEVLSLLWQPRAQFWFLYALLVIFVIAGLLYRRTDRAWLTGVLLIAVALYWHPVLPLDVYALNAFSQWFVFFAIGVSGSSICTRGLSVSPLKVGMLLVMFSLVEWLRMGPWSDALDDARLLGLAAAIIGIALLLAIATIFRRLRPAWLIHLGRHSMEIFLIHTLASSGARIVLSKGTGISSGSVHLGVGTLAGVVGPLIFVTVVRRYRLDWLIAIPKTMSLNRRFART
jgi:fucose 4-O-acetylase-like acetyltransferase